MKKEIPKFYKQAQTCGMCGKLTQFYARNIITWWKTEPYTDSEGKQRTVSLPEKEEVIEFICADCYKNLMKQIDEL